MQRSLAALLKYDWLTESWSGVNTVLRGERCVVVEMREDRQLNTSISTEKHTTKQHLMLTVGLLQQFWSSSDLFTCTEGYWLYYKYKCSLKRRGVPRKITPPPLQGLRFNPWLLCFWLTALLSVIGKV